MSRESRRTQPGAYRATTGDIDYIENQCVVEEVDTSCKYEVYEGQDIGYADIQVQAGSAKEVREFRLLCLFFWNIDVPFKYVLKPVICIKYKFFGIK